MEVFNTLNFLDKGNSLSLLSLTLLLKSLINPLMNFLTIARIVQDNLQELISFSLGIFEMMRNSSDCERDLLVIWFKLMGKLFRIFLSKKGTTLEPFLMNPSFINCYRNGFNLMIYDINSLPNEENLKLAYFLMKSFNFGLKEKESLK